MRNRFIAEHVAERRPACIKNRLRHAGFGKPGGIYVAYRDVIKLAHDAIRELVKKVSPRICYANMDIDGQTLLVCPLRLGEFFLKPPKIALVFDLLTAGEHGKFFKAKVNANAVPDWARMGFGNLNGNVEKPVTPRVFGEVRAVLDLAFWHGTAVEHTKGVTGETESMALPLEVAPLERNPSKRALSTVAKEGSVELFAGFGVLLTNRVDSAGMQAKFPAAAGGQDVQIEARGPALVPFKGVFLRVIAVIPDIVYCPGLLIQKAVQGFHAVAVNKNHFWRFRYSEMARRISSATESPVFSERVLSAESMGSGKKVCVRIIPTLYINQDGNATAKPFPYLPGINTEVSRKY